MRGLCTEGNLRFKIDWASLIVGSKFTGVCTLDGRFNGGFFALRVLGAYIWRGLYMEWLIFGILRYIPIIAHSFALL